MTKLEKKPISNIDLRFNMICIVCLISFVLSLPFIIFIGSEPWADIETTNKYIQEHPDKYAKFVESWNGAYSPGQPLEPEMFMTPLLWLSAICGIPFFLISWTLFLTGYGIVAIFRMLPAIVVFILKLLLGIVIYVGVFIGIQGLFIKKPKVNKGV